MKLFDIFNEKEINVHIHKKNNFTTLESSQTSTNREEDEPPEKDVFSLKFYNQFLLLNKKLIFSNCLKNKYAT